MREHPSFELRPIATVQIGEEGPMDPMLPSTWAHEGVHVTSCA